MIRIGKRLTKVLVTGGGGFIGSHLVDELQNQGYATIAIDINFSHRSEEAECVTGSIMDSSLLTKVVADVDIVFHLAASFGHKLSMEDPVEDMEINVRGTLNLLEACRKSSVKSVVYASTSAIFGDPQEFPLREDSLYDPLTPYSVSKLTGEYYTMLYHRIYGLPTTSIRLFNIYGPREYPSPYRGVVSRFLYQIMAGKPIKIYGSGEETRTFTFVKDAAQGFVKAAGKEEAVGQCFNIAGVREVSITELIDILSKMTERPVKVVYEGSRLGETKRRFTSIEKAARILGYTPQYDMEKGLKLTYNWFQENWEEIRRVRQG